VIEREDPKIHMIPIDQIRVLNPRRRGKKKFQQIVDNIAKVGLKRPVTVARNGNGDGGPMYDLVCGQGRLEAFKVLGQTEIPAFIIQGTKEDHLLMSLVENLARRQHTAVELVRQIRVLKDRGYKYSEIARKTDLAISYVRGIVKLLDQGEERLLQAVEKGQVPVSIAITIAVSDDKEVQQALAEAYQQNNLRGKAMLQARRLIEKRRARGKAIWRGPRGQNGEPGARQQLLRTYRQETAKQRMVIQKSKICETRLLFAVSALKQLFQDDNFVNLLRAEGVNTLPQFLADQLSSKETEL
jgi:ParB family chromosome partitioning protein